MNLKENIKRLAEKYAEDVRSDRRHIHANPELSFQECQTAKYVANRLKEFGLVPQEGIAETGVTALIEGVRPDTKTVALRADMDALPIQETNDVPYKSQNPGVMHACGHDVHTSVLLGAARVLHELRDSFDGTIKLVFQPAEEVSPGGAMAMIEQGVLNMPAGKKSLKSMFGQHVYPAMNTGKVGFRAGSMLASCDDLYIKVQGKGGHSAYPDELTDTVLIASQIVVSLQQIVSRNAPPHVPSVLSFGKIVADGETNIVPDTAVIEGTFRTFNEKWRADALQRIRHLAKSIAQGMGGDCEIIVDEGCPFLYNSPELTNYAIESAGEFMGKENVEMLPNLIMGSEDFAFYSHHADTCFWVLGVRNEAKNIVSNVHTSTFDIDEDALKIGVGLTSWLTLRELQRL